MRTDVVVYDACYDRDIKVYLFLAEMVSRMARASIEVSRYTFFWHEMVLRMARAWIKVLRVYLFLAEIVLRMARAMIEVSKCTFFRLKWY